ncbi:MAG: acyl-ACP--UDP-N-acetylglucosamine O-acyltransferase [Spirochaetota bacterium]
MAVHPTALIDSKAEVGDDNEIGAYTIIEGNVKIGNRNKIGPHTIITGYTSIGDDNVIHGHVYIGNLPQDVSYKGGESYVRIGNKNIIREFTTIHRGTKEGTYTIIGNNNYLMVGCHVAHNCILGSNIIMVNCASLGGYVEVYDHAFISAFVTAHQFTRIGSYSICGFFTKVIKDIPPFMMIDGNPASVYGINVVGLKRKGFSPERRELLKKAYKLIYRSGLNLKSSLEELKKMSTTTVNELQRGDLQMLIDFINGSKRGLLLKSPVQDEELYEVHQL